VKFPFTSYVYACPLTAVSWSAASYVYVVVIVVVPLFTIFFVRFPTALYSFHGRGHVQIPILKIF
ncbi:hypothetical protein V2J23_17240, partial [Geobacillus thermoleovorans]|uniref:hypothetical protein n=1 Tax=Geobacillus thermoleovorans TaxID=33941 RepID=UPI00395FB643